MIHVNGQNQQTQISQLNVGDTFLDQYQHLMMVTNAPRSNSTVTCVDIQKGTLMQFYVTDYVTPVNVYVKPF